jgi:oligoendopeptidase F
MTASAPVAPLPRWDLSSLYASPADPAIDRTFAQAAHRADALADRCRGRVAQLTPRDLGLALADLEALCDLAYRPSAYASLRFASDSLDPEVRALLSSVKERTVAVMNRVRFFDVELKGAPDATFARWRSSPELATYRHHLERERRMAPHTLSEPEERLAATKSITGAQAWAQLYDEITASWRFDLAIPDDAQAGGPSPSPSPTPTPTPTATCSLAELRSLRSHADRDVRRRAHAALYQAFSGSSQVLTYLMNVLFQDHRLDLGVRRFDAPIAPTLLEDELQPEVVEALLSAVEARYDLAHEYYRLKARALGLADFALCDLLAPYPSGDRQVQWPEAVDLVLGAYGAVSPALRELVAAPLERRHVDAEPRPGKRDGAFCSAPLPGVGPFVLMSYTGRLDDVSTLAHELGHAAHFELAGRTQRLLNYSAPTPLAETASVFGEMALVSHLLEREKEGPVRRQLLAARIEDALATIFRQTAYTRFEQRAHARRAEGVVPYEEYAGIWDAEITRLYGPDVARAGDEGAGFLSIPHLVHYRFYCYSYAFGQLLVYALYQRFRDEGPSFVPRYLELLAAGGSGAPRELLGGLGIDIADPAFWQRGLDVVAEMVQSFSREV